jgi:hypothetical protein
MSIQVQIAQDVEDDRATVAWLAERGTWLCLPRIVEGAPRPRPLDLDARALIVFPAENEKLVVDGVKAMPAFDGTKKNAASEDGRGFYMQWNRTHEKSAGEYVVGGADAARFYYHPMTPAPPRAATVEKVVKALVKHVQQTSPLTTEGRIPLFIGPHLAERWRAKSAKILYPNGTVIPLVPNAKHKAPPKRA